MGFFYDFERADAFATGAIGRPGERTFYLQVRGDGRTVSIKCEKFHVKLLAEHLRAMLEDMPETPGTADALGASLRSPVEEDFVLGEIGYIFDQSNTRMILQLEELVVLDDEDPEDVQLDDDSDDEGTKVRVVITPAQARAFCETADLFLEAGRQPCEFCFLPMDPSGHACPKWN